MSLTFIVLAGFPPTIEYLGTSFVTTLPAAITEPSPIVQPGHIMTFAHIQTFLSIFTGFNIV